MFVEVAVNLPPVRGTFHYHLPNHLEGKVQSGHLVTAMFGKRRVQGIVIALSKTAPVPETRPIENIVDPNPVLTPAQLTLAGWLSQETLAALIDCLTLMLPPGLSQQADSLYSLSDLEEAGNTNIEKRVLDLIKKRGPLRGRQLRHSLSRTRWRQAADNLVRRGVLERTSVLKPPQVRAHKVRKVQLAVSPSKAREILPTIGRQGSKAAHRRKLIIEALIAEDSEIEATWLYAETGGNLSDLRSLEKAKLVVLRKDERIRDPLADLDFVPSQPPRLTADQAAVWDEIRASIHATEKKPVMPFLLHGVTGSGKTEIYLQAVQETLSLGQSAIILVPEIALTPQTVRRFVARFQDQVGLIHSRLTQGERYDTWRRCRTGDLQVVIGPRSALFSPLEDIGLIVLDEAHDESYKEQGQSPRYHARETAMAYAKILHACCILGSATPDIVTTYHATTGKIRRLSLPQRILGHRRRLSDQASRLGVRSVYEPAEGEADFAPLPPVRIIDMRQELRAGNRSIFSRALQEALTDCLQADQQAMLFLNRRGSSTYIFCRDCGYVLQCPRCEISLTYHQNQDQLTCHHCNYHRQPPTTCPSCSSDRIKYFGAGTQRIQAEVKRLYPEAITLRWDRDATRSKGSHDVILSHFASHRADILIGTQMIAKGLDLPLVTLVGVVSADTGLNLPDFRATERTFQVLTQVAGRAGRGLLGGRVILQTYQPNHYAIRAASAHDYQAFYESELRQRQQLGYPPFRRLARLLFRHYRQSQAEAEAHRMAENLQAQIRKQGNGADLIGPVPCFFTKRRGLYRWQIIVRAQNPAMLIPESFPEGWTIDIDPVSLL